MQCFMKVRVCYALHPFHDGLNILTVLLVENFIEVHYRTGF